MAEGKKSFVAYADWKQIFDELPNEDAGKLIKHIFAYVNDENPETDNVLIRVAFANIKTTLKRDLIKWEKQLEQRRTAGRSSAESRKTKSNDRSTPVNETERNSTVSVSGNVNGSVNVKNISFLETDVSKLKKTHHTDFETFTAYISIQQNYEAVVRQSGCKAEHLHYFKTYIEKKTGAWDLEGAFETYNVGRLLKFLADDWNEWKNTSGYVRKMVY